MPQPVTASLYGEVEGLIKRVRDSYAALQNTRQSLLSNLPVPSGTQHEVMVRRAIASMETQSAQLVTRFAGQLAKVRIDVLQSHRLFKSRRGLDERSSNKSQIESVAAICMGFWLGEVVLVGSSYAMTGEMDIYPAFGYALIFSTINIVLGLVIGFWSLRYLFVKYSETIPLFLVRFLALSGLLAGLSIMGVLLFSALRVRATHTHHQIFNFEDVGFWATFNDGIALIVLAIASIGFFMAMAKGYGSIKDPVPGYSENTAQTHSAIEEVAATQRDDGIDQIDKTANDAAEIYEDAISDENDYEDFEADRQAYGEELQAHSNLLAETRSAHEKHQGQTSYVTGKASNKQLNLSPFEMDIEAELNDATPTKSYISTDLLNELETARSAAIADIEAAHIDYMNADEQLPPQ